MRISKSHLEPAEATPRALAIPGTAVAVAEWITRRELLWLALLAPFLIFPDRRWAWLVAALPLLWLIRFVARRHFLPATPLDWPIALLVTMVAVSLFATFSIDYSLSKVTGLLLGIASYYAIVEWITWRVPSTRDILSFGTRYSLLVLAMWGFIAAGAGLAIIGLFGTNWLDKMEGLSDVVRGLPRIIPGLPGAENGFQPNEVAGTLVLIALPAAALTLWAWSFRRTEEVPTNSVLSPSPSLLTRVGLTLCLLIIAFTLVLTQSRGALLGAAVGLLLVLWLLVPRLHIWLAGGLLAALIVLALSDPVSLVNKLLQPAIPSLLTTDPANVRVRFDIWSSALAAIRDAPITGIGMNTFRYIMPERYPSALVPLDYDVAHAHNVYLQVALDLGIPGLIAYIAIFVIAFLLLIRAFRLGPTMWHKAATAGIGAGLLAFLLFGITDAVALGAKPGIFLWALLALTVALWTDCKRLNASALRTPYSSLVGEAAT